MSAMGESYYNIHTARTHLHGQDLDSYSPVSSFNLPIQYDSSLVTPVSLTQSHPILAPASLASQKDLDIKLSPSQMSPTYPWLGCDDDYDEVHKPSEMKHKDPPGTRRISTSDSSFPPSPVVCYTPYFGQFGVSATPVSASSSSTSIIPSPRLNAANVLNNGDKHPGRNPSPRMHHGYLGHAPPTVLLSTPDSLVLRPSSKKSGGDYRQSSLQPASPRSMTHSSSLEPLGPLPSRRKRKPLRETRDGDVVLSGEMTTEEQILMQLTEQQNLPWKEVAARFKEQTGKAMKVPALQMRKKRLVERLRVWTPSEEQALVMAWEDYSRSKWETIANTMPKYGCPEKWPKELVEKKWQEMHPSDDAPSVPDYESKWDQRAWSDGGHSGGHSRSHSLHEAEGGAQIPTTSTATSTREGSRSRAGSGTASPLHFPQPQQHMMYENQQQHTVWSSGN